MRSLTEEYLQKEAYLKEAKESARGALVLSRSMSLENGSDILKYISLSQLASTCNLLKVSEMRELLDEALAAAELLGDVFYLAKCHLSSAEFARQSRSGEAEGDLLEAYEWVKKLRELDLERISDVGFIDEVFARIIGVCQDLKLYVEAVVASERWMRVSKEDSPMSCLCACAKRYAEFCCFYRAISLATAHQTHWTRVWIPKSSSGMTRQLRAEFAAGERHAVLKYREAIVDPLVRAEFEKTTFRLCSIDKCTQVYEKMHRCLACKCFYVCKSHLDAIDDHMAECFMISDELPDEKDANVITSCRRCRKETKLMKCGACGDVWYCGKECSRADWFRHKRHCKK